MPLSALAGRSRALAKNFGRETINMVVGAMYEAPQLFLPAGTADHWPLSDPEKKKLVDDIDAVADMLPKKIKTRALDAASKIFPPLSLLVTAVLLTKPRIDMTRVAMAMLAAQQRAPRTPQPTDQTNANVNPIVPPNSTANNGGRANSDHDAIAPSGHGFPEESASSVRRSPNDALRGLVVSHEAFG